MKPTIPYTNQQRLHEEQHVPRCNGYAMDKVKPEYRRGNHPAASARATSHERVETYQHHHKKAHARGAVEPTISLHSHLP
jgi:hypothetical protein